MAIPANDRTQAYSFEWFGWVTVTNLRVEVYNNPIPLAGETPLKVYEVSTDIVLKNQVLSTTLIFRMVFQTNFNSPFNNWVTQWGGKKFVDEIISDRYLRRTQ